MTDKIKLEIAILAGVASQICHLQYEYALPINIKTNGLTKKMHILELEYNEEDELLVQWVIHKAVHIYDKGE